MNGFSLSGLCSRPYSFLSVVRASRVMFSGISPMLSAGFGHVEAQGLLDYFHQVFVAYGGLHLHEADQPEDRHAEHLVHELYLDLMMRGILRGDVVVQAIGCLSGRPHVERIAHAELDRKSTRLNSSHMA